MMKVVIKIEKYEVSYITRKFNPLLIVGTNFPKDIDSRGGFSGEVIAEVDKEKYKFVCTSISRVGKDEWGYFAYIGKRKTYLPWILNRYATNKLDGKDGYLLKIENCVPFNEEIDYKYDKYADDEYLDCREDKRWELAERIFNDYDIPFETNEDARNLEWLIRYGETIKERNYTEKKVVEKVIKILEEGGYKDAAKKIEEEIDIK